MIDRRIDWEPAGWLISAVTMSVVLVLAVVATGRSDILVFLAPLVGAMAGAWWTARPERSLTVKSSISAGRLFEGEAVTLEVELTAPGGAEILRVELDSGPELAIGETTLRRPAVGAAVGRWELEAVRWGRAPIGVRVTTRGASGLLVGTAHCELAEVAVFPHADRIGAVPRPLDLPDMLGVHLGRRKGEGVEFAGIREYQPGDPLRAVNWSVSARRDRLHVTQRLTEQSAKVVCLIDASGDIHQPGGSSLELSVHGALAVSQAALRRGDRAGVVAVGGVVQWLAPDLGRRHFYQIIETLLDVRPGGGSAPSSASAFPRTMLPLGAVLVVFSPLLDDRVLNAVSDLRRRGFALAVVDVLRAEPKPRPNADYDEVAVRMWRIGRRGIRFRLSNLGVPVGHWAEGTELDEVLRPMSMRPLVGSRRG
ncbi:MAG TPA: DUF58 domain-containing protein [Pseudonocardia sp.]